MLELTDKEINKIKKNYPLFIGNRIKIIRKQKGITQTKLAELTNKDRQYIYKIEKGVVTPNIVTYKLLTQALQITMSELFTEENYPF